jgi:hypothetical protein
MPGTVTGQILASFFVLGLKPPRSSKDDCREKCPSQTVFGCSLSLVGNDLSITIVVPMFALFTCYVIGTSQVQLILLFFKQLPQVSQVNSGLNFIIGCLNRLRTVGPPGRDLKVFRCSSFQLQYGPASVV